MKRGFSHLLLATNLLMAGVFACAWDHLSNQPISIRFEWHKQKWELASTNWRLRLDNEAQRQMESDAPRVEAYRLAERLDELFDKERPLLRIPTAWQNEGETSALEQVRVQEKTLLVRLSTLGYIPTIGSSMHSWGGSSVIRINGKPAFLRSPVGAPPPATKLESLAIPFPLILLVLLLLPGQAAVRQLRAFARGLQTRCITCGYDLRASIDRCPECGAPILFRIQWISRWETAQRIMQRTRRIVAKTWLVLTPRTDRLPERWIFYVLAWVAILKFPIVLFDTFSVVLDPRAHWGRIGANTLLILVNLGVAAGSIRLTRAIPPCTGPDPREETRPSVRVLVETGQ